MSGYYRLDRRNFIKTTSLGVVGTGMGVKSGVPGNKNLPEHLNTRWKSSMPMITTGKELVIQPLLRHQVETPKSMTSWRNWGDVHTEESAKQEISRITTELEKLKLSADFQVKILPVKRATSDDEGAKIRSEKNYDVLLLYAAGGVSMDPCLSEDRFNLVFTRYMSGPMYDWTENVTNRLLRRGGKLFEMDQIRYHGPYNGVGPDDVIVDDYNEVLWRLKTMYGLHNFLGKRIIALGGAGGKGSPKAPELARSKFRLDILDISYDELGKRLKSMMNDPSMEKKVQETMAEYLKIPGTRVYTDNEFIRRCFYIYHAFKDLMTENDATAFTINECMGTIMKVSQSTACLPLSLLNDEGYLAFCESDFAVIPAGILLHYISGKPVFLCNPTTPHRDVVMCAHCTSPRRMDGEYHEPADIVTHYESDYGAAIKAYYRQNQAVTLIDPDAAQLRWLGFEGVIVDNPSVAACRSQHEIKVNGDTDFLFREMRGNHWMLAYGSWTKETGYACRKLGMDWLNISDPDDYFRTRKYARTVNPGNTF